MLINVLIILIKSSDSFKPLILFQNVNKFVNEKFIPTTDL